MEPKPISSVVVVVLFIVSSAAYLTIAGALTWSENHIVGGMQGWTNTTDANFYQEWAQSRNFVVGDKLIFLFRSSRHNVLEVSSEDFAACTHNHTFFVYRRGVTILVLTEPGPHYYLCGMGSHCQEGQKLSINVTVATESPPIISDDDEDFAGAVALAGDVGSTTSPPKSSARSLSWAGTAIGLWIYVLHCLFF